MVTAQSTHLGWTVASLLFAAVACSDEQTDDPIGGGGGGGGDVEASGGSGGDLPGSTGGSGAQGTGGSSVVWPSTPENSPEIELWYGDEQIIGGPEQPAPQRWVNVLGRITEPTASSATYRVNDGPARSFPFGPSTTRLLGPGDFNLEVERAALLPPPDFNSVDILVETGSDEPLFRRVYLQVYPPVTVAPDLYVDFSALPDVAALNQVAAVVDGLWELTDDGVRTTELGYDRLIALGSQDWSSDYEVLAEFTLHYWRNWGAVGVAVGWQGHTGAQDPREDWPLEALGWVRKVVPQPELQIMAYSGGVLDRRAFELVEGNTYLLRTRTERGAGNARSASLRIWPAGADEPADWLLETAAPLHDGSVLLVAHHADVTWHNVTVTPL